MWHKPCRTFHPWCLCIKTRCLFNSVMLLTQGICSEADIIGSDFDGSMKMSYQFKNYHYKDQINGLVQERCNSSALAMELSLSCTDPSSWLWVHLIFLISIPKPGKTLFISKLGPEKYFLDHYIKTGTAQGKQWSNRGRTKLHPWYKTLLSL